MTPEGTARELPAGTVTLLFSDIEGSTMLLSRLGNRYGEALSAQRAVLRAAISKWRGHELGTEGDSFFVVFASAADAVACCVAAQRALGRHEWPGGAAVRVRMGLHSGEPTRHEDGYIGIDVHRAARIAAAAHGGQVVMSHLTWQLARSGLPAGLSVRDLGFHRLKDIDEPAGIYQLAGLAGAAATVRQIAGMPLAEQDAALLEKFLGPARAAVTLAEWDAGFDAGRALSQEEAAALLLNLNQSRAGAPCRGDRDEASFR